jgi:prephenate dehydrogenase
VKLGIAGVGLIGGSIGLRAAELGWDVTAWEPDAGHLRLALRRGACAASADSLADLAAWSEVLVLAAPLDATLAQLAELSGPHRAVPPAVFDVASVKAPVAAAASALRGFVATHPIAGSERSGPAAARADLFAGRVWTFDSEAPAEGRERARDFILAMGARPVPIANREHDRIVAFTSHLPQLLSVALGVRLSADLQEREVASLCGTGIASMLRLAGSSWTVWQAILATNAQPVAQEVRRLAAILSDVATDLESGTVANLASRFAAAATAAERVNANGPAAANVDSGINQGDGVSPPG